MKNLGFRLALTVLSLVFASPIMAQTPTPDQLIDQLTQIDCNGPGLYDYFPFPDFWAVVPDPDSEMHLQGPKSDCVPAAMRALVRLGPRALPALVRHIGDTRRTRLMIGRAEKAGEMSLGGQSFEVEYDSRAHVYDESKWLWPFMECPDSSCPSGRSFREPYTIRVGDVCFALIGQIVNRRLVSARYQMTGFVIINSPIEMPWLAERVQADWSGVDAKGLKNALLADLHTPLRPPPPEYRRPGWEPPTYEESQRRTLDDLYRGALRRLRFYFPETYATLSGSDLKKRRAFETAERETWHR